jgi:hypothetical protein
MVLICTVADETDNRSHRPSAGGTSHPWSSSFSCSGYRGQPWRWRRQRLRRRGLPGACGGFPVAVVSRRRPPAAEPRFPSTRRGTRARVYGNRGSNEELRVTRRRGPCWMRRAARTTRFHREGCGAALWGKVAGGGRRRCASGCGGVRGAALPARASRFCRCGEGVRQCRGRCRGWCIGRVSRRATYLRGLCSLRRGPCPWSWSAFSTGTRSSPRSRVPLPPR